MKKILLICACLLIGTACKSSQSGVEARGMVSGNLDPRVDKLLGGSEIYTNATRVIPVIVNPEQGSGDKKENLESYAITKKGKALSPEQTQRLQNIIFNAGTYNFEIVKKCLFQPYVGFIFEKAGKQSHAIFCFSCDEVAFGRDGKQGNLEDFDAARKEVLALAKELFPTDQGLAKLN